MTLLRTRNFTFLTNPSASSLASITLASCHSLRAASSSLMITRSSGSRFLLGKCHFCLTLRFNKYAFRQRDQNCSARNYTLRQRFRAKTSSLTNFPGGGMVTLLFIVNRRFGVSGIGLVWSLRISTVSGRPFTIACQFQSWYRSDLQWRDP